MSRRRTPPAERQAMRAISRWSEANRALGDNPGKTARHREVFLRGEVGAAVAVARAARSGAVPTIDGDGGPTGAGRGPVERATVLSMIYSPRTDRPVVTGTPVVRRSVSPILARLSPDLQETAARYAYLSEVVGAVRGTDLMAGGGSGGVSDGGAAARCDEATLLRRAREVIGDAVVIARRGRRAQADRAPALTGRRMVDAICVDGWSVERLLASHGLSRWVDHKARVKDALIAALMRAQDILG